MKRAAAKRKTRVTLDWKDCECGCHGSTLDLLGIHFSLFFGQRKVFLAVHQHHPTINGTPYDSYEKAMEKVREVLTARLAESERETEVVKAWLLDG